MQVSVDYRIQPRDLFCASIWLARWRILLGAVFSISLISGVVIFFLILDEKKVLLETSPLFIGFPLLAVGGQILRQRAVCYQYVRSLSDAQRSVRYVFSDNEEGLDVRSGHSYGRIAWSDISRLVEKSDYFLIFVTKYEISLVPKSGLGSSQIDELRRIFARALNSRVRLMQQPN